MLARNVSIHLKSNLPSDDKRTVATGDLLMLCKQNVIRTLIVGGMLLGLLPGVCFAQRASQHATPSATAAPNANTVAPNEPTVAPNAPAIAPDAPTLVPDAPAVAPSDASQKPPIPSDTGVNPDVTPPSSQP